jgi:hypothetical protein
VEVNFGDLFVRKGSKRLWRAVSFFDGGREELVELAAEKPADLPAPRRLVPTSSLAKAPWKKIEDREVSTWASLSWDGCGSD